MSAPAPSFAAGLPVEIGKIDRELKKLWDQGGEVMSRASLINLAVYSEAPDSLNANTQIVAQITEDHACRAIVIAAHPGAGADRVESWISAHCHVSRAGSKQVCSEQISFSLEGSFAKLLPNIVFSHLDSDLPFYFWWQGEFHDPMDEQLWTWVDRLIFDSQRWSDFDAQMKLIEIAETDANQRIVLCDLNWTRLVQVRLALAQFFDPCSARAKLAEISRVEIDFGPDSRSTAVLLAGWLAAQLKWKTGKSPNENSLAFTREDGKAVEVALRQVEGEPITRCRIFAGTTEFCVTQAMNAELLQASVHCEGKEPIQQLMPAGRNDAVRLMSEELMRGGPHHVYLRAVNAVRAML